MISRFFRGAVSRGDYAGHFELSLPPGIDAPEPKWNIAPMSLVPVIRPREYGQPGQDLALKLWGLVPQWWRKPLAEKDWSSFNARAEDIGTSATFRGAYRYRRCLIPASGFYVWSGPEGRKVPFSVGLRGGHWFCMGGVWERWGFDGGEYDTFALVTVGANALVGAHAERMPLIVHPEDYAAWLDPSRPAEADLLAPFHADAMVDWPAHPNVGNVRNQDADLTGTRRE